jgi:sugar phosphate isomerase/epimerase
MAFGQMKIHGIGKDVADNYIAGRLSRLEESLTYYTHLGYTVTEVPIGGLNVVVNGQLLSHRVQMVKEVLSRYPVRYTVHGANRTNLAYGYNHELEKSVMRASIEFCREIGAKRLVYHSGLQALNAARTGTVSLPDDDELKRGAEREILAFRELAPFAADADVIIGMENGDPHLWEYAVLMQNNQQPEDLPKYHARLRVATIVQQLEAIDHPNVGMTLDLAHLHLATHALGDDYLESIRAASKWVRHLHLNDNFGKLDVGNDNEGERLPYGEADLHLPPGWGAIPFVEAFKCLSNYEGDMILEIKTLYWDNFGEALENIIQLLTKVS